MESRDEGTVTGVQSQDIPLSIAHTEQGEPLPSFSKLDYCACVNNAAPPSFMYTRYLFF